jgi:hypothetical protein
MLRLVFFAHFFITTVRFNHYNQSHEKKYLFAGVIIIC